MSIALHSPPCLHPPLPETNPHGHGPEVPYLQVLPSGGHRKTWVPGVQRPAPQLEELPRGRGTNGLWQDVGKGYVLRGPEHTQGFVSYMCYHKKTVGPGGLGG